MIHHYDTDEYINSTAANDDTEARDRVLTDLMEWARVRAKSHLRNGFGYLNVDDCVQDMMLAMLIKWPSFNGEGSRVGWLKMNGSYALLNLMNERATTKVNRTKLVTFIDQGDNAVSIANDEYPAPLTEVDFDETIYKEQLGSVVRDALKSVKLTKNQRSYITHRFWNGLKGRELAAAMGTKSKPDNGWIYVKPKLREILKGFYYGN